MLTVTGELALLLAPLPLGQQCAGIVDDHLPTAGAQANDLIYIIVRGPVLAAVGSGMTSHSGSVTKQGEPSLGV